MCWCNTIESDEGLKVNLDEGHLNKRKPNPVSISDLNELIAEEKALDFSLQKKIVDAITR